MPKFPFQGIISPSEVAVAARSFLNAPLFGEEDGKHWLQAVLPGRNLTVHWLKSKLGMVCPGWQNVWTLKGPADEKHHQHHAKAGRSRFLFDPLVKAIPTLPHAPCSAGTLSLPFPTHFPKKPARHHQPFLQPFSMNPNFHWIITYDNRSITFHNHSSSYRHDLILCTHHSHPSATHLLALSRIIPIHSLSLSHTRTYVRTYIYIFLSLSLCIYECEKDTRAYV